MSALTRIAASKTATKAGLPIHHVMSRHISSTKAVQKSAVRTVVRASCVPLSSILSLSPPPSTSNASKRRQQEQHSYRESQKLSVLSAADRSPNNPEEPKSALETDDPEVDMAALKRLAAQAPTPLRLGDMYKYAASTDANLEQRLRNAQFLHRELPLRLAQRAYDLLSLPLGLSSESTPIRTVAKDYVSKIQRFKATSPPQTPAEEDAFTELLHGMVSDRTSIPTMIAQGLMEWLGDDRRGEMEWGRQQEMEDALVRFFTARVGLRFLAEHHILSGSKNQGADIRQEQTQCDWSTKEKDRGCIQHDCNPVAECEKVAQEVARQTYDCYGICPNIEIVDRQSPAAQAFTYVPHHLHYMLAELLKNSCRATVERYMEQGGAENPEAVMSPIKVVIVKGAAEVTIKVSDEGGGIPRSTMARIFKFTHSTSRQEYERNTDFGTVEAGIKHMRGFGLPLARIYARYFGGELTLKSMEGYGLDAYLYLPRLGDACENLPPRVSSSPGEQVSLPSARKSKDSKTNGATTRSFSTMPSTEMDAETALRKQSTDGELDQPGWEEAKIRRVLQILRTRAL